MKFCFKALFSLIAILGLTATTSIGQIKFQKLKQGGSDTYISLTNDYGPVSSLILYSEIYENTSSAGEVFLNANVPLKARVEYKKISKRSNRQREATSSKGWIQIDLDINGSVEKYLRVQGSSPELSYKEGVYGKTFFSFDSCDSNSSYLVRIIIDLSKVSLEQGILIHSAFRIVPFKGSRGASLKPMGEGKYKSPLLLISSIGGGEVVRVVNWRGKKISNSEFIPFPDYVGYRGQLLARVPLNSEILKGGKGVFEIILPGIWIGYSTCFELRAFRQYSGGYKR